MTGCENTICRKHRSMPLKAQIASYWSNNEAQLGKFIDWGEPSCWGCGFFASKHDVLNAEASREEIMKSWNKQDFLERAHIIPKGLKGCNCESNLVLLCRQCHKANPDTDDRDSYMLWLKNRMPHSDRLIYEMKNAFAEQGLKLNPLDFFLMNTPIFIQELNEKAIQVSGRFTIGSKISVLKKWKLNFTEDQLLEIIPSFAKTAILDASGLHNFEGKNSSIDAKSSAKSWHFFDSFLKLIRKMMSVLQKDKMK